MRSLGEPRQAADVILLGINLSKRSKAAQLGICTGGFFVAYLIDGVAEEFVYARAGFRHVCEPFSCYLFGLKRYRSVCPSFPSLPVAYDVNDDLCFRTGRCAGSQVMFCPLPKQLE